MPTDYLQSIRALIGHDMILFPSTACIVVQGNQVLLQHRADNYLWGLPGGIMDIGETVVESVVREVKEETGLTIIDPVLFGIYSGKLYEGTYANGDRAAVVQMVFMAEKFTGELRPCDEGLDVRFVDLDDLPETMSRHHSEPVQQYRLYRAGELVVPVIQ
jgi:ADP-ribose pyrophosphatase YjhB (NUDIX family)